MAGHLIHRIDEFLPHLARLQPHLLETLPFEERPPQGMPLSQWVLSLPQPRLVEICSAWVLESLQRLRERSPLTNVLLRGCLLLPGEFDAADAGAIATGDAVRHGDPRHDEIRHALTRAVRVGLLISLPAQEHYCLPFPVRLSFEGVEFLDPLERDSLRLRAIHHFAGLAREMAGEPEAASPRHWRFTNLLGAYEMAVEMMEEVLGLDGEEWTGQPEHLSGIPEQLAEPLRDFCLCLGKILVTRRSATSLRLIAAGTAAAHSLGDDAGEGEALNLLGQCFLWRKDFPGAVKVFRRWAKSREDCGSVLDAVIARSAVALALREGGDLAGAVEEFRNASEMARRGGLPEQQIDTANCAAAGLLELMRPAEVVTYLGGLRETLESESREIPAFAETLVHWGTALRLEGVAEEARSCLRQALELAGRLPHRPAEAMASFQMGLVDVEHEHWEAAARWLERSRELFAEVSGHEGAARAALELFPVLLRLEQPGRVEQLLPKALRAAQASRNQVLIARVWGQRGELAIGQEQVNLALGFFHNRIEALRRTSDAGALVEAHLRIAEVLIGEEEAYLAAGAHVLRAQAVSRAYLGGEEGAAVEAMLSKLHRILSADQFEYLVHEVTGELEEGKLLEIKQPREGGGG